MKHLKVLLSIVATLILVVGCSNQGQTSETNGNDESASNSYFINPKSIGPAYWSAAEKGVKQAGEDLGVDVTFNAPSTTIAFMVASLSAQNQTAKVDAAKAYLEENHPDIEIVSTVSSEDDQQKAFENAQNLISTHPDLEGLVGFAGAEAPAAAQAVEQAVENGKIEEGQVTISGFAVPSLVEEYLKNGTIDELVTWNPTSLGYATVHVLNMLSNGEEVKDGMEIPTVGSVEVTDDKILIGTEVINKDNVSEFDF